MIMGELDKIGTEESNYHIRYECRWCGVDVLEDDLEKHQKNCEES